MTEPEPEDDAFAWEADDASSPQSAPSRDIRRVGVVLGVALVVLIVLVIVLLQVLGNVFGELWNSVFTF